MDNSVLMILQISVLTVAGMIIISSIIYFFERDKRQLLALEYWLANGSYFVVAYLTSGRSALIVATGTIFWIWRLITIRKILEGVCEVRLKRGWHIHFLIYAYLLALFCALRGWEFISYTLPQALAVFILGLTYLFQGFKAVKTRGKNSVNHYLLFITLLIYFFHVTDYPFFRLSGDFSTMGFGLTLVCNILMAVILPSVTIYELKRDQQLRLEKLVEERGAKLLSQAKFSALGEMTAGIAHEINNPLGIITNRTFHLKNQILKDSAQKDFIVRNLDQIEANSDRMSKIIRSLKNFSRDNKNEPWQTVSVRKIIDDTMSYCQDRFRLSGVEVKIDPYPDAKVECRVVQISQVVLNLLNNSFDAIAKTPDAWVHISFEQEDECLAIIITDSGKGIPEAIRKKIMEPFFTTKEVLGTGLGLSISKGIVEDHEGRLFLDDKALNTTFVIQLPYRQKG